MSHASLWLSMYSLSAITIRIIVKLTNHKSSEMHKMIIISCQRGVLIYSRLITGVKQALQLTPLQHRKATFKQMITWQLWTMCYVY